jgi:prevent-host-death family protein
MVIMKVNVFEVKAKLSEYLDRALGGERVVICRHNRPVAELRAVDEPRTGERPIGPLPGRPTFDLPPSFFEPMSDAELDLWEGKSSGAPAHGSAGAQPALVGGGASRAADHADHANPAARFDARSRRQPRKRR